VFPVIDGHRKPDFNARDVMRRLEFVNALLTNATITVNQTTAQETLSLIVQNMFVDKKVHLATAFTLSACC